MFIYSDMCYLTGLNCTSFVTISDVVLNLSCLEGVIEAGEKEGNESRKLYMSVAYEVCTTTTYLLINYLH